MLEKPADTDVVIHDLIAMRWSPRAFDPDKVVTQSQILSILEAARWAPSCFNAQPWRFVVCDKQSNTPAWLNALQCISEKNRIWAQNAPLLILSVASTTFEHNEKSNRWAQFDTGAATENLVLQATAIGLSVHQMGGFDSDKAHELFKIPVRFVPMSMIAVGYQASPDSLDAELKSRELAKRSRQPREFAFFNGKWNSELTFDGV